VIRRYLTVRFDEKRKGGTLLALLKDIPVPSWTGAGDGQSQNNQGQDAQSWDTTLSDGDTIVVRAPSPGPQMDSERQTPP
jgi:molybdopterin converting factor small subunit